MLVISRRIQVPDQGVFVVFKSWGLFLGLGGRPLRKKPSWQPLPGEQRILWQWWRIYRVRRHPEPEPSEDGKPICRNCAFFRFGAQDEGECVIAGKTWCVVEWSFPPVLASEYCGRFIPVDEFVHTFDRGSGGAWSNVGRYHLPDERRPAPAPDPAPANGVFPAGR